MGLNSIKCGTTQLINGVYKMSNPFFSEVKQGEVQTCNVQGELKTKANIVEKLDKKIIFEKSYLLPKNDGMWAGSPGNSEWKPDLCIEPGDRNGTNPKHKTWSEITKEYKIESISFKDGEPDFSEVAKAQVEINDFSDDRDSNFDQADEKLAEQKGCTPEEVAKWREENKYTWHECRNCATLQKVPTEVHGNIVHTGGISEYKLLNRNV